MKATLALFWVAAAVVEAYRRLGGVVPGPLWVAGPYLALAATVLPAVEAVRELRSGALVEGVKWVLWALPGAVTLAVGPGWLRFGG